MSRAQLRLETVRKGEMGATFSDNQLFGSDGFPVIDTFEVSCDVSLPPCPHPPQGGAWPAMTDVALLTWKTSTPGSKFWILET